MTITNTSIDPHSSTGFFNWLLRNRLLVIVLTLFITCGFGAGLDKLEFSSDYRDFFDSSNPKLVAFEALQDKFVRTNNVFVAIESKKGNIFTKEGLHTLIQLTDKLWSLPHVIRIDSVTNHQFINASEDNITVSDLMTSSVEIDNDFATEFHKKALLEKGLNGLLVTTDPALTGINISFADSVATEQGKIELMSALDALLDRFSKNELITYKTGSIAIDRSFDVAAQDDVETLYGLMYLLVLFFVWLLTRSMAAVFGLLISVTFSWFIALGLSGWLGIKLTAVSVSAPMVLMTLAVAQSMHIIFSIQKKRAQDVAIKSAIEQALQDNIKPLSLVSLSTTIGFLAITGSEVPPLQDLGFMLTVGMIAVFVLTVTFLPVFLSFFSLQSKSYTLRVELLMKKLGFFIAKHAIKFLIFGAIAIIPILFPITQNVINDNFIEYFDEKAPIRTDSEYISDHLTGVHQVYFELESAGKSEIFNPDYLQYLEQLTTWLLLQPEIRHVSSLTDVLKRLNRASFPGLNDSYQIPGDKSLAAQLYLMYEMSLPYGLTTSNLVDIHQQSTRLTIVLNNLSSAEILSLEEKINAWHQQHGEIFQLHPGTGPTIMFADIGQRNAESLVISTLQALLMVSLIMLVALRSIKLSVISLVPNLLPVGLAFGVWGLIDGEIGLAISIVAVMTFGIVVDDTIYFLTRFKENLSCKSFEECISRTFRQVGNPILNTTLILTCGFLVLTFSNFRLNQGMGMLTAIVIFIALICDLFLLPGLIKLFAYKNSSHAHETKLQPIGE